MTKCKSMNKKILIMIIIVAIMNTIIIPIKGVFAATTYTQTLKTGIEAFPEEYKEALKQISKLHPNWTFDAYYTGLNWDKVASEEIKVHGRNRVHKDSSTLWKCYCNDVASGYTCASEGIVKYYLDPRNFLNEVNIFQFLEISYNSQIHNLTGVENAVKNTFLDNSVTYTLTENGEEKTYTKTYSEIILEAAKQSNMSPYSIVAKIIQEVGTKGSESVSGTNENYKGYYNFFNIGANDKGNAIENGLEYAKKKNWNNQYTAIIEGAKEIANSYTNAGQNTAYFYKWDVVGIEVLKSGQTQNVDISNMFWHQYMTNVQDPTSQSKKLYNTYVSNGIEDSNLNFIIPVYNNMPSENLMPSGLTTKDGDLYEVNCTDGLRVRTVPSTSASKIITLYKTELVAMIERECTEADGYKWDKVKLANGTVGYVASKYLTFKAAGENIGTGNETNSEKQYKYEDNIIIMLMGITIDRINGNAIGEVKTGAKIIIDGKEYTAVVLGDTNGDGKIDSADLLTVRRYLLSKIDLIDEYIKAADINNDGKVDSADLLAVRRQLLGKANISL